MRRISAENRPESGRGSREAVLGAAARPVRRLRQNPYARREYSPQEAGSRSGTDERTAEPEASGETHASPRRWLDTLNGRDDR
jgi:hypothetical protein